jgi:flagellar biosynthesis protein FlhG
MTSFDSTLDTGPLLVALGSGNGGAGRTTIALELARVLSRRGFSTVLVDCALHAPLVADLLGRSQGRRRPQASLFSPGAHLEDFVERVDGNALSILTLADAVGDTAQPLSSPPAKFSRRLRRLDDKVVILDLPPGPSPYWLDLFMLSDVPIIVAGPDPWSVRSVISFVTTASRRAEELLTSAIGRARLTTYLTLNGCRDASERELGEVLCHAIWRKHEHYPRYLGPIDHDDRRWFHLRHGGACPALSSSDGLGVQVEELAKRILGVRDFNQSRPRTNPEGHLAVGPEGLSPAAPGGRSRARYLGMSESAPATDLRAQYRRLWEGYRRESAISQVVLDEEERRTLTAELERTYRALQTAMDSPQSQTAETESQPDSERAAPPGASLAEAPAALGDAGGAPSASATPGANESPDSGVGPAEEPEAPAEHCGDWIRGRREELALSLKEMSLRTRIGLRNLEAIEAFDREALPPAVYLRGYLREIARALDVSVESLLDRYLSELAA